MEGGYPLFMDFFHFLYIITILPLLLYYFFPLFNLPSSSFHFQKLDISFSLFPFLHHCSLRSFPIML